MGYVYVYGGSDEDLTTTGLVGALTPTKCEHEEIANGMSTLTLTHPFDEKGRWKALREGNILSASVRCRATPYMPEAAGTDEVEVWTVNTTATKQQLRVFAGEKKNRKKGTLIAGRTVYVLQKGEERYQVRYEKLQKKKYIWQTGWAVHDALSYTLTESIPDGIEAVCPEPETRQQLFRILSVRRDTENGVLEVTAEHVSSDDDDILTTFEQKEPLTAREALDGLYGGCDWTPGVRLNKDIGDTRTSLVAEDMPLSQALLDPEEGFAARWGAELIRDDFDLYFLRRAGRDRGVRIEHAKNLIGAVMDVDFSNTVTAVKPRGAKKNGDPLYLTDDEPTIQAIEEIVEIDEETETESGGTVRCLRSGNYVMSEHAHDYPVLRTALLDCEDCQVEKGNNNVTTAIARARMLEQAKRRFEEDKIDLPDVSLTVNFVELGDTVEYARYAGLETVCLFDEVGVRAKQYGIEVMANVRRMVWDCLTDRVIEVELGDVREDKNLVYSWQIPSLPGGKLTPGTVPGTALEEGAVGERELDPDMAAALEKALADIESARELLLGTGEWLDAIEAQAEPILQAVADNEGNIAALQQTASEIRAGLQSAEDDLAAVQLTASQLQTAMTNAQGDISTLIQRADGFSSTIQSINSDVDTLSGDISTLSGSVSSIRQTANSISSTVSSLNGQVQSLITQVAGGVAIKLMSTIGGTAHKFEFGTGTDPNGNTITGLSFSKNDVLFGGLYNDYGIRLCSTDGSGMRCGESIVIISARAVGTGARPNSWYPGMSIVGSPQAGTLTNAGPCIEFGCDCLPFGNGLCNIGSSSMRFDTVYRNRASTSSDIRYKKDIEPLNAKWLLDKIKPIRYRYTGCAKTSDRLRFGFAANGPGGVQEIIKGTDIERCAFLNDDDRDHLALCYEELISVLVEGYQYQAQTIDDLAARVARLEGQK